MRMHRPRFTMLRMMIIVALTGALMAWAVRVRGVLRGEEELSFSILFSGMLMLSAVMLLIIFVAFLVGQDFGYAAQLRRSDVPGRFPSVSVDDGSPQPWKRSA